MKLYDVKKDIKMSLASFAVVFQLLVLLGSGVAARVETFGEWRLWKSRYPNCDPRRNDAQSPIRINTNEAKDAPHFLPLLVITGPPAEDCFFFSVQDNFGGLEMEAISIMTPMDDPACDGVVSYISGGGKTRDDFMYFKRAILFFTRSSVESERSLHQIDERKFQMEIAMEFVEKTNLTNSIGLHLMVEVFSAQIKDAQALPPGETPENPVFKHLELSLSDFKRNIAMKALGNGTTKGETYYDRLEKRCLDSEKEYNDSYAKQLEEMKNLTYDERLGELQIVSSKLGGITKEMFQNYSAAAKKAKDATYTNSEDDYLEPGTNDEIAKLRERIKELTELIRDEESFQPNLDHSFYVDEIIKSDAKIKKLKANKTASVQSTIQSFREAQMLEDHLEGMKVILETLKVGIPGEAKGPDVLYESPEAVYEELKTITNKSENLKRLKKEYISTCTKLNKTKRWVKVDDKHYTMMSLPFQLSWLFPGSGGYYLYKGSNPVPPCESRDRTLVFENPVRITTAQLEFFQSIPSLIALRKADPQSIDLNATEFDKSLRVDKMVSILHKSSKPRQVWRVSRNIKFIGDDGFRKEMKLSKSDLIGQISGKERIEFQTNVSIAGIAILVFCNANIGLW